MELSRAAIEAQKQEAAALERNVAVLNEALEELTKVSYLQILKPHPPKKFRAYRDAFVYILVVGFGYPRRLICDLLNCDRKTIYNAAKAVSPNDPVLKSMTAAMARVSSRWNS